MYMLILIKIIFILSFAICLLNLLQVVAIVFKSNISFPSWKWFSPHKFLFFYPSLIFQIWYWFEKINFF